MQSTLQENNEAATWNQLAPLLDEAVSRLGKKDRDAVMLRFFQDQNLREVAAALNVNLAAGTTTTLIVKHPHRVEGPFRKVPGRL